MKNTITKYVLDDFTRRHLRAWFERGQAPCAESSSWHSEVRMIHFLENQTPEDAEYAMGQGWHHVFYRATEIK